MFPVVGAMPHSAMTPTINFLNRYAIAAGWVLIFSVTAYSVEPIRLMESNDLGGTTTFWEVTAEQLRSWPRWDPTKEPPLPISGAVEKAFQALPTVEKRSCWQLDSIKIQQPMGDDTRKDYGPVFFYFVTLSRKSDTWSTFDCLMNLNGEVVPFKTEKLPRDHESTTIIITPNDRRQSAK